MRQDHKLALKKVNPQILAFCLRHNYRYGSPQNHWIQVHLQWLRSLKPEGLYQEILSEYLSTYDQLTDKLERLDRRIEELATQSEYQEKVQHMSCFLGIKTQTAHYPGRNWRFQTLCQCAAVCFLSGIAPRRGLQRRGSEPTWDYQSKGPSYPPPIWWKPLRAIPMDRLAINPKR